MEGFNLGGNRNTTGGQEEGIRSPEAGVTGCEPPDVAGRGGGGAGN